MFKLSKSASASPAPSNSDNEYDSDYNDSNYSIFKPGKSGDNYSVETNNNQRQHKKNQNSKETFERRLEIHHTLIYIIINLILIKLIIKNENNNIVINIRMFMAYLIYKTFNIFNIYEF